jgi:probable HAF family extracellular repeat protein
MKSKRLFLYAILVLILIVNNFVCAYNNVIDLGQGSARSVNDNGQIVGGATNNGQTNAYLFDSTGGGNNIDLNTLIDPSLGWTLTYAYDISNNGWIVGEGTLNGQTHAFLLVVPEPATIVLLTLGGLVLRLRSGQVLRKKH